MKWSIVLVLIAIAAVVAASGKDISADELESKHNIVARSTSRCNAESCTKHCRKLGHVRGVCIGSYCQCRALKKRSIIDPVPEIPGTYKRDGREKRQITGPPLPSSCTFYICIANCKKRGHINGGICTLNGCACI